MGRKSFFINFAFLFLLLLSILGVSYALWMLNIEQTDQNVITSGCFETKILSESDAITLEEAYPMSEEEAKDLNGYTFIIKNICTDVAYYEVNLEEMIVSDEYRLDGKYISLSLNGSEGKKLNSYEEVESTLEGESDESHKLTIGKLEPEESKEYTLKLWVSEDTPAIDEVMNAHFQSKVSIVTSYIDEEKLANEIEIKVTEPEEYQRYSETVTIKATSKNYNLVEYSYDNVAYEAIEESNKTVTLEKEEIQEGTHEVYFKDEVGNIKKQEYEVTKLDQEGPEIQIEEKSKSEEQVELLITFKDIKSGLKEYQIDEEEIVTIEGKSTQIEYTLSENKKIIIIAKDQLGNESKREYDIEKQDLTGPEVTIHNPYEGQWTKEDITITIEARDENSGVNKFYYRTSSESEWQEIEDATIEGTTGEASLMLNDTQESTYEFRVTDNKGNEQIKTSEVKIDKDSPQVSITKYYDLWGSLPYRCSYYQSDVGIDGIWETLTGDPHITFDNVLKYTNVTGVYIEFDQALSQDIVIQVFWNLEGDTSFSDTRLVNSPLKSGTKSIYISLPQNNYKDFRFDIGTEAELKYKIKHIALETNDDIWTNDDILIKTNISENESGIGKKEWSINQQDWNEFNDELLILNEVQERDVFIKTFDVVENESNIESTNIKIEKTSPVLTFSKYYDIWGSVPYRTGHYKDEAGIDGTWESLTGDPQIIFENIQKYTNIDGVYIELEEPMEKDMKVQVFWNLEGDTSFSDIRYTELVLQKGKKDISLSLPQNNYKDIRVDIGTEAGLKYKINHIALETSDNIQTNDDIIFTVNATDVGGSGIQRIEWSTNKLDWNEITDNRFIINTSQVGTIYIRAFDNAGNLDLKNTGININKTSLLVSAKNNHLEVTTDNLSNATSYTYQLSNGMTQTSLTNKVVFVGLEKDQEYEMIMYAKDDQGKIVSVQKETIIT